MAEVIRVTIGSGMDSVTARQRGRALARELGFSGSDGVRIATAISKVARNIIKYAKHGEIVLEALHEGNRTGVLVIARDAGPGIPNVELAMLDGYSTSWGLGLGLPGAQRLMDQFEIAAQVGVGTTVTMKKWVRHTEEQKRNANRVD
jgi:serine/threonine-protein kinase RsbT